MELIIKGTTPRVFQPFSLWWKDHPGSKAHQLHETYFNAQEAIDSGANLLPAALHAFSRLYKQQLFLELNIGYKYMS